MTALIFLALNLLAALVKSKSRLEAENAALRQQLIVLQRKMRGRVGFSNDDRLFFVQLYRWFPSIPQGNADYPARDVDTVAPCRVSRLLALEVSLAGVDPANEPREPALGCAAHSRRAAQAWIRSLPVDRSPVHGEEE